MMTRTVDYEDVPNLKVVKERVLAIDSEVEFVKAGVDETPDDYLLQLQLIKRTTLRMPKELVDDLNGKNTAHRDAQLEQLIRSAIGRLK